MSFTNKVVLVTGSSSGIGAAIALQFAREGANVAIVGRNEKKLKKVSEDITKVGKTPLVIAADVTKDADNQRIVNETLKRFGKIDVLINNAGVGGNAGITDDNAMEVFDRIMATNLRSVVYLSHLASKSLIETKGNIINISSAAGQCVLPNLSAYCTSKAGMDHFSRSIALELAPKGVRVNILSPGPVKTDFVENAGYASTGADVDKFYDAVRQRTALKRVSEPSEMAELAFFLASDKAVGITGSTFVSDDGYLLVGSSN